MTISLVWSANRYLAVGQYITEVQLFVLFLFVFYYMKSGGIIEDYLISLYISGFLLAIYALYKYKGINGYMTIMLSGRRLGGEISNENTFGLVFANASLIALYLAIMKGKKIHYLSLALFLFFGFSSGSKKYIFLVATGVIGIALINYGWRKIYKTLLGSIILLYVGIIALNMPIFSTINIRFQSYLSGNLNTSDETRKNMIDFGIDLFKERPIFGYGLNNYRNYYYTGQYSHNNFIELLVCLGIVGFLLFYAMYFTSIKSILMNWIHRSRILYNEHKMLLFLLVVNLVFGYGMVQIYDKNVWILLAVSIAIKDNLLQQTALED